MLKKCEGSRIINISSCAGHCSMPGLGPYSGENKSGEEKREERGRVEIREGR
jgi:hypothetical protein